MKNKILIIIPLALLMINNACNSELFTDDNKKVKPIVEIKEKNQIVEFETNTSKPIIDTLKSTLILKGEFYEPIICKGESILYNDGNGYLNYLKDKNSEAEVLLKKSSVGNEIAWSENGELIFFKEKTPDYKIVIKSIDIFSKEVKQLENYPSLINLECLTISDTIYFIDNKTLEVKAKYNNKEWGFTFENHKGNYYKMLISPNNKYLAVHFKTDVLLFTTDGKFIRNLGTGIATDWSPNSDYLIGYIDKSTDGYSTNNSEIIKFILNKETPEQITSTTNAMEMWPTFKSPNIIVYADKLNNGLFSLDINN